LGHLAKFLIFTGVGQGIIGNFHGLNFPVFLPGRKFNPKTFKANLRNPKINFPGSFN